MTGAGATADGDQLIARRVLQASLDRVWVAFTTPAGIAAFWGGAHATVAEESVEVQLRPGGEFSLVTKGPAGGARRLRFVYVDVRPPHRLVFDEPVTGIRTIVRLETLGEGTSVVVHQYRLPPELRTRQAADGLASILDALACHLGES